MRTTKKQKINDVLVLNKSWIPIQIIGYQRAISLIYQDHARALDREFIVFEYNDWLNFTNTPENDFKMIHTVNRAIAVPEIILLTKFSQLPQKDVKFSRENVFHRDRFTCQYCGRAFKKENLTVDHVIPKQLGGTARWNNIVACCKPCNAKKANMTPEQAGMKLRKQPVQPKWISPIHTIKRQTNGQINDDSENSKPHIYKSWIKFLEKIDYSD